MNTTVFGIDLGTYNIKLYHALTDDILVEKNMIAIENRKTMIAYGDEAYEMYEKAPASIQVSSPIVSGVIADIHNMETLLNAFVKQASHGSLKAGDFYVTVPSDITEVEKRAFSDLIKDARIRAKKVYAVDKAIADGLGMGIDVKNSQGVLIVDVGYDTTEISILSLGGIVLSRLIKVGGHSFDASIVSAVRREFNLVIGMKTAEKVRMFYNDIDHLDDTCSIFGRDIVTGLPVERTLNSTFVAETLSENFRTIADSIRLILEKTPPELAADIYRHGVFLTGGGSMEEGLAQEINLEVSLPVNLSENPLTCAVIGLSQVMKRSNYRSLAYTIEVLGK